MAFQRSPPEVDPERCEFAANQKAVKTSISRVKVKGVPGKRIEIGKNRRAKEAERLEGPG